MKSKKLTPEQIANYLAKLQDLKSQSSEIARIIYHATLPLIDMKEANKKIEQLDTQIKEDRDSYERTTAEMRKQIVGISTLLLQNKIVENGQTFYKVKASDLEKFFNKI